MSLVATGLALFGVCLAAVLAIWAGYPLAIAWAARRRPAASGALPEPSPFISVVLATRDEPDAVARRVDNLLASAWAADRIEVVIAVDATRRPDDYVHADRRVVVVSGDSSPGKASNLNAGIRAARGEVLVFADTAQRFTPGTIAALAAPFADPAVGATTGWLELPAGVPAAVQWYWRMERRLRWDEARLHSSVGVTGAVWALRASLWSPLPPGVILDDLYTPMRLLLAGQRVVVARDAVAHEQRAPGRQDEYARKVRTLTGVYQVCALLPGVLSPRRNPVWGQFLVHKLLRMATPLLVAVAGLGVVIALAGLATLRLDPRWWLLPVVGAAFVLAVPPGRRAVRRLLDAALLQFAAVTATRNALRRRWNVWH